MKTQTISDNFSKEIEDRKSQMEILELKNTIIKIKIKQHGQNRRLEMTEERTSNIEGKLVERIYSEQHRANRKNKKQNTKYVN